MSIVSSSDPDSTPTRRDPARTRERLLSAGFEEVYRLGFQGSDLNSILGRAGVTKGALYHHFDNKEALGHAIISDVVGAITDSKWLAPLRDAEDPISVLIAIVESTVTTDEAVAGGCPLNNLAQEMSGVDEGFRTRIAGLFTLWIDGVAEALERGQARGFVRGDIDAREAAMGLIASYEGYFSIAKSTRNGAIMAVGIRQIVAHLNQLRPEDLPTRGEVPAKPAEGVPAQPTDFT